MVFTKRKLSVNSLLKMVNTRKTHYPRSMMKFMDNRERLTSLLNSPIFVYIYVYIYTKCHGKLSVF